MSTDLLVLGLPRGGVPVAYEIARALDAPLDALVVRKLGVPGHEELAMGAIASGGIRVLNSSIVAAMHVSAPQIAAVVAREADELARREMVFRGSRQRLDATGKTVILVDDGLATGSTMLAAIDGLRTRNPARIIVAVPVAPRETCERLRTLVDDLICLLIPPHMHAVGLWYDDFTATSDDEVRRLLEHSDRTRARPSAGSESSQPARASRGV